MIDKAMRRIPLLPYLISFAAVLLAYGPALRNGFVWDDTALVLRDPLIRSPWLLGEGLRHFLFLDATPSSFYRPLQRAVFTLNYALAGFTPSVFHLANLLVHSAAAVALYEFSRRLFLRERMELDSWIPALAASVIWAVHPIHSSAVVYVAGLADPLVAALGFSGLALLLANRRVAAGLCLGAAVFAKESGIFLMAVGLAFAWGAGSAHETGRERWKAWARVALPALLMAALYLGLRASAERRDPPAPDPIPAAVRPIIALRAVAEYGQLLVCPATLRMERDVRTRTGGDVKTTVNAAIERELAEHVERER